MAKVMIAMSGGVDSAVAAQLLCREGHEVIGATMKLYCPGKALHPDENGVMISDEIADAALVARCLHMPHMVLDLEQVFLKQVVDRFVSEYECAKTPNPCIFCNSTLKFGEMMRAADQIGAALLATGHYAQLETQADGRHLLKCAADMTKDQSYVLYMLTQAQLSRIRFPLGAYTKAQVREIAQDMGFVNAHKGDSQDICFIPDGDYAAFIARYTGKQYPNGDFVDADGTVLGTHRGIIHYTIGQRKGLGIALGKPAFVCRKDAQHNTVMLGDNEALFSDRLTAENINWIPFDRLDHPLRVRAKVRYNMIPQEATVEQTAEDRVQVIFEQPQRAITPGQSVVFYDGAYVIGGGIIV